MIPLSIAPDLMEEAVLLAERRAERDVVSAFRRERDGIYEIADPESREVQFQALALRWFDRLGLRAGLEATINEHAEFAGRVTGGRIVRAAARAEERADLVDAAARGQRVSLPLLVLRLRPESLLEPDTLRAFLHHELMHVADILDPSFGYRRALPPSDDGPPADTILRDRYRVLWDVTIDGRLALVGQPDGRTRETRWREFRAAFAMLGDAGPGAFESWWSQPHPTHAELVAFATTPARSAAFEAPGSPCGHLQ